MSSTVGTGQVIATTSVVEKVAQWQQTQGDAQQKVLSQKSEETERRKKERVAKSEKQDKVTLAKEEKEKQGKNKKGRQPGEEKKPAPENVDGLPGKHIDITI